MSLVAEIAKRRTFGIISHPDAGKTTLTEKLLLFGGAIQKAGAVKSNKIDMHARSDWMDIEKQRGISVATSVMAFEYEGTKINLKFGRQNGKEMDQKKGIKMEPKMCQIELRGAGPAWTSPSLLDRRAVFGAMSGHVGPA